MFLRLERGCAPTASSRGGAGRVPCAAAVARPEERPRARVCVRSSMPRGGTAGEVGRVGAHASASTSKAKAIAQDSREEELALAGEGAAAGAAAAPPAGALKVVDVRSIQQLINELEEAGDKLAIVAFHATWCQACRRVQPMLQEYVSDRSDVVLLRVNYDHNKSICKALSVKKLPYFHFYRGSQGKLADFSASKKTFHRLEDALAQHGTPRCSLGKPKLPEPLQQYKDEHPPQ
mmetsp:Transcript_20180/g.42807  ORF Transcript_20180/g.42807 Transcript_20180/m.42807 type:complete len:234 (-) Transcript_20180:422-1123(-)